MAVLNIKNLPDSLYRKLRARAKRQHRSVAQEVTHLLSDALETPKPLSILDLKGWAKSTGEELTHRTCERERASWIDGRSRRRPLGVDTAIFIYFIEEHPSFFRWSSPFSEK